MHDPRAHGDDRAGTEVVRFDACRRRDRDAIVERFAEHGRQLPHRRGSRPQIDFDRHVTRRAGLDDARGNDTEAREGERRAQRRMPRERELRDRREDPQS